MWPFVKSKKFSSNFPHHIPTLLLLLSVILLKDVVTCSRSEHARRLFQDILTGYNKLLRPVQNTSDAVTVKVKLRLSQLLDVHEKNQIITTNIWIKQVWTDSNINWDPNDYGGVDVLYVPADQLWTPTLYFTTTQTEIIKSVL
ncbi:Acetylcholine receptor subunit alpha-like [Trichinella spiralis]|uniref:Acetylcholine receptor subunit alpha-like n=1 Tax=Trichinella spiralis TaxID=6334 RepID=A0ABR3KU05_TRISP